MSVRQFALVFGATYTRVGVLKLATAFGLAPLFGHNVWRHALSAVATGAYGFTSLGQPERRRAGVSVSA